jgi:hypothetical protein
MYVKSCVLVRLRLTLAMRASTLVPVDRR